MNKILANLFLCCLSLATLLGNYWFTYGLWPKSWWSFFGFGLMFLILIVIQLALAKEDE